MERGLEGWIAVGQGNLEHNNRLDVEGQSNLQEGGGRGRKGTRVANL